MYLFDRLYSNFRQKPRHLASAFFDKILFLRSKQFHQKYTLRMEIEGKLKYDAKRRYVSIYHTNLCHQRLIPRRLDKCCLKQFEKVCFSLLMRFVEQRKLNQEETNSFGYTYFQHNDDVPLNIRYPTPVHNSTHTWNLIFSVRKNIEFITCTVSLYLSKDDMR